MSHPAFHAGATAVITGGAAGIGLALGCKLAEHGMKIAVVDTDTRAFTTAERALTGAGAAQVMLRAVDVTDRNALEDLETEVAEHFGGTDILINNAGIQPGSALFGEADAWRRVIDVNLWGVINGTQVFAPAMIARDRPGLIVNTGSKQGITTPPGDPAYNVSKAGVKAFTEALAHELRSIGGCRITAHLLIPGFVFTGLTRQGRSEKPDGAWTPEQLAVFALPRIEAGDFYILCPDNEVDRALDEKRMAWAMGDIIENRPPLSRWHPDFADAFRDFVRGE